MCENKQRLSLRAKFPLAWLVRSLRAVVLVFGANGADTGVLALQLEGRPCRNTRRGPPWRLGFFQNLNERRSSGSLKGLCDQLKLNTAAAARGPRC